MKTTALGVLVGVSILLYGADRPTSFAYDPLPRWQEDPETEDLCKAMIAECGAQQMAR